MHRLGFVVPALDFKAPSSEWEAPANGILNKYTPPAVHFELAWTQAILARGDGYRNEDALPALLELPDGRWVDLQLCGMVPVTRERAFARRREIYELYVKAFNADVVTITLGLAEAWWDTEENTYIQQIPAPEAARLAPRRFQFRMLTFEECRDYTLKSVRLLLENGKRGKKIVMTTSPIPVGRTFTSQDVLIANTYAKSMLRVVAGMAADSSDQVEYFPSYECVTLSRDPAIWVDDLIHVQEPFITRIVEYMVRHYVEPDERFKVISRLARARAALASSEQGELERLMGSDLWDLAALDDAGRAVYHVLRGGVLVRAGQLDLARDHLLQAQPGLLLRREQIELGLLLANCKEPAAALGAFEHCDPPIDDVPRALSCRSECKAQLARLALI